ncbi:MAG: yscL [Anaerosporomusa subterranea]|nr:yscL [Anaerosporomusa subterranea]
MSKIIKQVKLNNLPVVINNLCLVVSDDKIIHPDDQQQGFTPDITLQVEARAVAIIEKAKLDMEKQSSALYEHSKKAGFAEGKEQGYSEGKDAGYVDGKEAGYADGFTQGEEAAKVKMESAVHQAAEEATRIIAEANRQAQLTVLASEKQILDIALAITEKILACEIDANSQAVVAIVKSAMDKVRDQSQITVRVNPADFEFVIAAKSELEAILQREQSVEFAADQTVSRGGCVIDSTFGSADARMETQLHAVRAIIRSLLP